MLDTLKRHEFFALMASLVVIVMVTAAMLPPAATTAPMPENPSPQQSQVQETQEDRDAVRPDIEPGFRWRQGMARFIVTDINHSKAAPSQSK